MMIFFNVREGEVIDRTREGRGRHPFLPRGNGRGIIDLESHQS